MKIKILFLLLGVVGFSLLMNSNIGNKSNKSLSSVKVLDQVYTDLNQEKDANFFNNPEKNSKSNTWWITQDGWNILTPSEEVLVKVLPKNFGEANKEEFRKLNRVVKRVMDANGFVINKLNSSDSEDDTKYYDYVQSYENKEQKCVVTSSPDVGNRGETNRSYSDFTVGCFTDSELNSAYKEQIPFLMALQKEKGWRDNIVYDISIKGDLAKMAFHGRRTGFSGLMYRENGEWKVAFLGQAAPSCDEVYKSNVPKAYWPTCYDIGSRKNIENPIWNF